MCEKAEDRSTQPRQVEPKGLKDKGILSVPVDLEGESIPVRHL